MPLKFQREGIKYDELSDEEKEQWDAIEWDDDGNVPRHCRAEALNRWLFNEDTVDKVLEHLMTRGRRWRTATGWERRSSSPRTTTMRSSSPSVSMRIIRIIKGTSRA